MKKRCRFIVIGCGPGCKEYITPAAIDAAQSADTVIGTEELLTYFSNIKGRKVIINDSNEGQSVENVFVRIDSGLYPGRVAFLTIGDSTLFSVSESLKKNYGRQACEMVPGISPMQVAFARIRLSWVNTLTIYAHTPNIKIDTTEAERIGKVCIFLGGPAIYPAVAEQHCKLGNEWTMFICENLTLPDEKITEIKGFDHSQISVSKKTVVLLIHRNNL